MTDPSPSETGNSASAVCVRSGVMAGGHFIVDHIKLIDHYPAEEHLAVVQSETRSGGGGPYNLLCNLSAMQAGFALQAVGLIGDDADGAWIAKACRQRDIDTQNLQTAADAGTAWTDVMSVAASGRRTFFHYSGANALLADNHFDFADTRARIFYLGYLGLLDGLDAIDGQGRTGASQVFERARAAGMITAADLVSHENPELRQIIAASAPYLDYLLLNELEAGWIVNRTMSGDQLNTATLADAAREILDLGVATAVIVHCEYGAVCAHFDGRTYRQGAVQLPEASIQSKLGAGDAFAAGFLYGIHEDTSIADCLHHGVCAAAACLCDPSATGGMRSVKTCLSLAEKYGIRQMR